MSARVALAGATGVRAGVPMDACCGVVPLPLPSSLLALRGRQEAISSAPSHYPANDIDLRRGSRSVTTVGNIPRIRVFTQVRRKRMKVLSVH